MVSIFSRFQGMAQTGLKCICLHCRAPIQHNGATCMCHTLSVTPMPAQRKTHIDHRQVGT